MSVCAARILMGRVVVLGGEPADVSGRDLSWPRNERGRATAPAEPGLLPGRNEAL
jgi:hypothetical protein